MLLFTNHGIPVASNYYSYLAILLCNVPFRSLKMRETCANHWWVEMVNQVTIHDPSSALIQVFFVFEKNLSDLAANHQTREWAQQKLWNFCIRWSCRSHPIHLNAVPENQEILSFRHLANIVYCLWYTAESYIFVATTSNFIASKLCLFFY